MATVQVALINRALRMLGRLGSGRSPTANETADCLLALNAMLDSWRTERLTAYALTELSHTLVSGTGAYAIGSGATIDTTRPVKIHSAYIRDDGLDYPLEIVDKVKWARVSDKDEQSDLPELLWYDSAYPTGTINLWTVPTAADTLYLTVWTPLTGFSAASETLAFPPGYENALAYNLAVEMSPEFGDAATPLVMQRARETKAAIKRVNLPSFETVSDLLPLFGGGRSDILGDR